ncbi:hypothetical protein [Burkholderia sp. Ac-20344]|uniref:hypothetical protein n=1 Tax=Burkholderia sp. Ac-20344 TaxID=2703890 RepID=UPI00197BC328|nr:hypothetical protein [Burkholderia sp. Ac-20344]MBN3832462.1 hypothetical protein [Burkholderia sp. Ac-20344]
MLKPVRLALARPCTFIVLALLILIAGPLAALRAPTDIYHDVVTAQTTERDPQIASLDVDARRLQASVGLVRALGGWHDARS